MSAWQNPTDSCPGCGQDILLRPEITSDVRMIYVRYCPRCDAGEPIVQAPERPRPMRLDADLIWGNRMFPSEQAPEVGTAATAGPVSAGSVPVGSVLAGSRPAVQDGVDIWWDGDGANSPRHAQLTSMDARWARFAASNAGDEDDDEMPLAAEGSFSFSVDGTAARRRKPRFARPHRERQSA